MEQTSKLADKIFFSFESKTVGSSPALLSSVCIKGNLPLFYLFFIHKRI